MRVFENIEIEFFDPQDQVPNSRETVIIILKTGVSRRQMNVNGLIQCRFYQYKTVKSKFEHIAGVGYGKYLLSEVKCWGRLVKS